jgi:hypothetical protein
LLLELPERLWSGAQLDSSEQAEAIVPGEGAKISTEAAGRQEINDNNNSNSARRGSARG